MPCPVAGSHGSYAKLGHWSSTLATHVCSVCSPSL
jgi:hypothetical protein